MHLAGGNVKNEGIAYVVDHQRDGGDIDTTGKDIGGDENFSFPTAERINDRVTLRALDTTSQGGNSVSLCDHAALDLPGGLTSLIILSV